MTAIVVVLTLAAVVWTAHAQALISRHAVAVRLRSALPVRTALGRGKTLPSAFNDVGNVMFVERMHVLQDDVFKHNKTQQVGIAGSSYTVTGNPWWASVANQTWEPHTYRRYFQYVTPSTTLVDFGTWIGPTLLFGATRAARAFGIEGDPVAYADTLVNLQLNAAALKNVHLQPGCVSVQREMKDMRSAAAGNSCSGVGDAVACGNATVSWKVQCYDLPFLFKHWGVDLGLDTFIKIDVESYECALIPSMVEWLLAAPLKPTLSLAMHSQVSPCDEGAYAEITRLATAYKHVECASGSSITLLANADLEAGGIGKLCPSGDLLLSDHMPPADKP
jgi:hypothetical protein